MKKTIEPGPLYPFSNYIIAILILIIGFFMGQIKMLFGWEAIIMAVSLSIFTILFALILMRQLGEREMGKLGNIINDLEIKVKGIKEPEFIDPDGVVAMESLAKVEVCIFTPTLSIDPNIYLNTLISSLKQGIKHKYIFRNDHEIINRFGGMVAEFKKQKVDIEKTLEVRVLDGPYFLAEFTLYDPNTSDKKAAISLPWVHQLLRYGDRYTKAFYLTDPEPVEYFVGVFDELWELSKPLELRIKFNHDI